MENQEDKNFDMLINEIQKIIKEVKTEEPKSVNIILNEIMKDEPENIRNYFILRGLGNSLNMEIGQLGKSIALNFSKIAEIKAELKNDKYQLGSLKELMMKLDKDSVGLLKIVDKKQRQQEKILELQKNLSEELENEGYILRDTVQKFNMFGKSVTLPGSFWVPAENYIGPELNCVEDIIKVHKCIIDDFVNPLVEKFGAHMDTQFINLGKSGEKKFEEFILDKLNERLEEHLKKEFGQSNEKNRNGFRR
jgi:hypothetical protein